MLNIDVIRRNPQLVAHAAKQKNRTVDVSAILTADDNYRKTLSSINDLRARRNSLAKAGNTPAAQQEGREIKEKLKALEERERQEKETLNALLLTVPNIPYDEVPEGKGEEDNKELYTRGTPKTFDFPVRSHIDLVTSLDLADFERGSKVSGFRGYFLKRELAILHMAILWYAYTKLSRDYIPLVAPSLVKEHTLYGNGQFPWGREEVYHLEKDNQYLAGTAEVPVTAYFGDEILSERDLPQKFVAVSPCFRREAGSYGKDTKGLYRLHEFWKIEQVVIAPADDSLARTLHEELQKNTEGILQDLELPYRVLLMCTGDMGEPQAKKYDTEVWMPYRKGYGEIASNSIMTDFQARRLNIRYRSGGETKFCYTLNDTLVPSPRILIAILENYQQKDGSILIPHVLQSLTGFDRIER